MLKKLLAMIVVLLMAAFTAVPALAQTVDLTLPWGSEEWFRSMFGVNGDITEICNTIGQDPATEATWTSQFPDLPQWCGWDQQQGSTQQTPPPPSQQQSPSSSGSPQTATSQQGTTAQ